MVMLSAGELTIKIDGSGKDATLRLGLYDTNARDLPAMNRAQVNRLVRGLQSAMAREMNPRKRKPRVTK